MNRQRVRIVYLSDHAEAFPEVVGWLDEEWFRPAGLSRQDAERRVLARLNRDRAPLALLARAGGRPVGAVSLTDDEPAGEGACFLTGLYVVPGWRRRGVGARLCRRAVREARRLRLGPLRLYTRDAQAFYARLGWRPLGETPVTAGRGLDLVTLMEASGVGPRRTGGSDPHRSRPAAGAADDS